MSDELPVYDRELLLLGGKRNAVLDLWEVQRYGSDSYGDTDYVSVYGMRPDDWHAKGARLLGRTVVECTRDRLGDAIGKEVAAIAGPRLPGARAQVVDLFAGSGNTLYWLLRHLPGSRGRRIRVGCCSFPAHSAQYRSSGVAHRHLEHGLSHRTGRHLGGTE